MKPRSLPLEVKRSWAKPGTKVKYDGGDGKLRVYAIKSVHGNTLILNTPVGPMDVPMNDVTPVRTKHNEGTNMKRNTRSITESPSLENADELKNTIADAIVTMMVEDMPVHEIVTGSLEMVRESLETPELETVPGSEFAGMVADDVLEILMNSYEFREDIKNVAMGVLRGLSKPTRPEAPSGFAYGDEGKQDK